MAKCDYCGSGILFGGVKDQGYRFCNAKCQQFGNAINATNQVSPEVLEQQVNAVHRGNCPRCGGSGPVDVHTSHRIWSAFVLTAWSSRPHICCSKCGRMEQLKDAVFSLFLGWWGFPWGIIITPIQVIRNIAGMLKQRNPSQPSRQFRRLILINIGMNMMQPPS